MGMKHYEFVFLTKPGLNQDKLKDLFSSLEKQIEKVGGKAKKKNHWGTKSLVYPIKKQHKADFYIWQLDFNQELKLKSLNTFLNRQANIIRYLLLSKEE